MDKEKSEIKDIFCPKCSKKNAFINGKCIFCNTDIKAYYEKSAKHSLVTTIIFFILALCSLSILNPILSFIFFFLSIISFSDIDKMKENSNNLTKSDICLKNCTIFLMPCVVYKTLIGYNNVKWRRGVSQNI